MSMETLDADHSFELLKAQTHGWNHIFRFISSMSLRAAIELGIPDEIHKNGKPMTLNQLTAVLPLHPSKSLHLYRLLRILVHSGFFSKQKTGENDEEEAYALTNASKLLLKDNPLSITPFLMSMLDPILTKPWYHLATWFSGTEHPTPFDATHGISLWDYAGREPKLNHSFNEAMASDARLVVSVVMERCKGVFKDIESLVDVGGGTGTVSKAIAKEFPHIHCTVLDLPHVVAGLESTEKFKYVGGDMFHAIPPADAVLLKSVLHDWNDEECVAILKNCKESITSKGSKHGKLIIVDMTMENQKEDSEYVESQLFFDMLMMVLLTGKERNEEEWSKLLFGAGFSDYKTSPVLGLRSLIEAFP